MITKSPLLEARIRDLERFKQEGMNFEHSFGIHSLLPVIFYLLEQRRAIETQAVGASVTSTLEASFPPMWELRDDGTRVPIILVELKAPERKPQITE